MGKTAEKKVDLQTGLRRVRKEIPGMMKAWGAFHQEAMAPGALSEHDKELVALGIALALRCSGCIVLHVEACKKHGVTRDEILDVFKTAWIMGGGPVMTQCVELYDALDEYYQEEKK